MRYVFFGPSVFVAAMTVRRCIDLALATGEPGEVWHGGEEGEVIAHLCSGKVFPVKVGEEEEGDSPTGVRVKGFRKKWEHIGVEFGREFFPRAKAHYKRHTARKNRRLERLLIAEQIAA